MQNEKKSYAKLIPAGLAAIAFIYLLFAYPKHVSSGVQEGLTLCGQVIIPTLFPFVVVALFIAKSGIADMLGKWFAPITNILFHLPGNASCVIFMSLIGGYPVGIKMINELYSNNEISKDEAERMSLFCVNAGPL